MLASPAPFEDVPESSGVAGSDPPGTAVLVGHGSPGTVVDVVASVEDVVEDASTVVVVACAVPVGLHVTGTVVVVVVWATVVVVVPSTVVVVVSGVDVLVVWAMAFAALRAMTAMATNAIVAQTTNQPIPGSCRRSVITTASYPDRDKARQRLAVEVMNSPRIPLAARSSGADTIGNPERARGRGS